MQREIFDGKKHGVIPQVILVVLSVRILKYYTAIQSVSLYSSA